MSGVNAKVLHAQDTNVYQQPSRRLQFVVGRKGKHELLAIGGRSAHVLDPRLLRQNIEKAHVSQQSKDDSCWYF